MIDPITAISAATAAYNGIVKLVKAGREVEDCIGQLGKWYGAAADINRAETQRKNPPLFAKMFAAGSVEEEALAIIIHKKKLAEQEKNLQAMLNMRFGFDTWKELIELRRKIRKEREETIYRQMERRKAFFDACIVFALSIAVVIAMGGGIWLMGIGAGWWG
jgi:hypothetical protein